MDALNEVTQDKTLNYYVFRNEVAVKNKIINGAIKEDLEQIAKERILKTVIRRSEHIGQASFMSLPVSKYKQGSTAINDYKSLAKEILTLFDAE